MRRALIAIIAGLIPLQASAAETPASLPYQGFETRSVKALSEKDAADLLAGRGAGYALAAELNGHPGPLHVLELAEALALSPEQRTRTQAAFDAMQAEARAIGAEIVAAERELDRGFATGRLTADDATRRSEELGRLYGRYRAAHLKAHLEMTALLTPQQVARYGELRGYAAGAATTPDATPNTSAPSHHRPHH